MTAPDSLEKIAEEIVRYVYDYVENADCSCEDPAGTCWYHMNDQERVAMLTRWVLQCNAARIEALIPSKAEREFLEAALTYVGVTSCFEREEADRYGDAFRDAIRTYRALLAERTKDA